MQKRTLVATDSDAATVGLESVTVEFDGDGEPRTVLKSLSAVIHPREVVGVIGPNGCGKTTFLRTIAGLIPHSNGTVRRATSVSMGFVFQDVALNLLPWLRVVDNVALPGRLRGDFQSTSRAAAREALERIGITHLAERFPWELSGGQQQLTAFARWLVAPAPRLLLLDEALSMLDVRQRERARHIVKQVAASGSAVVLVSHDLADIAACAHRVLVLSSLPATVTQEVNFDPDLSKSHRTEQLWDIAARF